MVCKILFLIMMSNAFYLSSAASFLDDALEMYGLSEYRRENSVINDSELSSTPSVRTLSRASSQADSLRPSSAPTPDPLNQSFGPSSRPSSPPPGPFSSFAFKDKGGLPLEAAYSDTSSDAEAIASTHPPVAKGLSVLRGAKPARDFYSRMIEQGRRFLRHRAIDSQEDELEGLTKSGASSFVRVEPETNLPVTPARSSIISPAPLRADSSNSSFSTSGSSTPVQPDSSNSSFSTSRSSTSVQNTSPTQYEPKLRTVGRKSYDSKDDLEQNKEDQLNILVAFVATGFLAMPMLADLSKNNAHVDKVARKLIPSLEEKDKKEILPVTHDSSSIKKIPQSGTPTRKKQNVHSVEKLETNNAQAAIALEEQADKTMFEKTKSLETVLNIVQHVMAQKMIEHRCTMSIFDKDDTIGFGVCWTLCDIDKALVAIDLVSSEQGAQKLGEEIEQLFKKNMKLYGFFIKGLEKNLETLQSS